MSAELVPPSAPVEAGAATPDGHVAVASTVASGPVLGVAPAAPRPPRWSRRWWAAIVPRPTELAAALAVVVVLVTPLVVRPAGLVAAGVLVALVAVDAWLLTPAPHRVGVGRVAPAVVVLGTEAPVTWHLRSPVTRRLRVAIADELPPSLGLERRHARTLPPRGTVAVRASMRPWRRGTRRLGVVTVRVTGRLRLATRQQDRDLPGVVEVHPAFPSRQRTLLRIDRARLRTAGNLLTRQLGGGTEFDHLSEYRFGDDVRRVDWGATARLGHPVVRRYRVERDRVVQLLVEHGRSAATVVDGVPRLDHTMDAAMAVVTAAGAVGDRAGVVAYADRVTARVPPARRADQVALVARALHGLEPTLVEADHRGAFSRVAAAQRRRALLVVLTDLGASAALEDLRRALPVLVSRHEVVVASVTDPAVAAVADHEPVTALDAHHAAGAASLLARRARAEAVVSGLGAAVVSGPPVVVAERLVDRYLDLKRRGRA